MNLLVEGIEVGFAKRDGLFAYHGEQFLAAVQFVEVTEFGDVDACGFFLVFLQEVVQDVLEQEIALEGG